MPPPDIAVLVSTFQRPGHLSRSLRSLAMQRDVRDQMEVIVTDDGSVDETREIVADFARTAPFPVRFTTHPHAGFRLSQCRNEGVCASTAPYLLFTDGDCIFPPDHIRWHLDYRRPGQVVGGDCYRLDEATSTRINDEAIRTSQFVDWIPDRERRRLRAKAIRAEAYHFFRCRMLPRLTGNNIGLWRTDYERVNGFDENFVGWGFEDRDLQRRLSRLGLRFKSILRHTASCHLWHPPAPTFSRNGVGTPNLEYYERRGILTRCLNGLVKRTPDQVSVRFVNEGPSIGLWSPDTRDQFEDWGADEDRPEIEVLTWPGRGRFSGRAECNILAAQAGCQIERSIAQSADLVVPWDTHFDWRCTLPFPTVPMKWQPAGGDAVRLRAMA